MKKGLLSLLVWAVLMIAGSPGYAEQPLVSLDLLGLGKSADAYDSTQEYVPDEILLRFSPEADSDQVAKLSVETSMSALECIALLNLCRMRVQDGSSVLELAQRLEHDRRLLYAEPNYIDRPSGTGAIQRPTALACPSHLPTDPGYPDQWHYRLINLPKAWGKSIGRWSMVTAVVDTGVRFEHPDLAGRLSVSGYDFIDNDRDPTDPDNGHGTHVSGTIAAAANNGLGGTGITWKGKILPVRTLGTGGGTHYQFARGFLYAAGLLKAPDPINRSPAKIINYSGGGSHSRTKEDAVKAVNAAGVIMVCAAGNSGARIDYPAAYSPKYPLVICVGATNYANGVPKRAFYSSKGLSMNIVAPGGDISQDSDHDGNPDGVLSTTWDFTTNTASYDYWMGTSMAAPHATGLAALMLACGCPAGRVRAILQDTATDLGPAGFDTLYGYGLIDADKALKRVVALFGAGNSASDSSHSLQGTRGSQ
jgi:subtilisin family serine protease